MSEWVWLVVGAFALAWWLRGELPEWWMSARKWAKQTPPTQDTTEAINTAIKRAEVAQKSRDEYLAMDQAIQDGRLELVLALSGNYNGNSGAVFVLRDHEKDETYLNWFPAADVLGDELG